MDITWLGHASFRIAWGDQVLLVDPWLTGNPMLGEDQHAAALEGATHILLTHGHQDHSADAAGIAKRLGIPVVGIFDLMGLIGDGIETIGFNRGGTVQLGDVAATMVAASHSSSVQIDGVARYAGNEGGYMLSHGGRTLYVSGDTDIMADMDWMGDLHKPEVGILCAGGHFTMDMARAAYAAKRYFNFKTVIPCHYRTFPLLEQSADVLADGLPGVDVIEPQIMQTISL